MICRRKFGELLCGALAAGAVGCRHGRVTTGTPQRPQGGNVEAQQGDPDMAVEGLIYDARMIASEKEAGALGPNKDKAKVALRMLAVAESYVGSSRARTPEKVALFLKLFGLKLKYPDGSNVPFCAAGVSFSACQAYCDNDPLVSFNRQDPTDTFHDMLPSIREYYFQASSSCITMMNSAKKRQAWVPRVNIKAAEVKPGWLVFFDWKRRGIPQHVGIIRSGDAGVVHTVEFNTSGTIEGSQINGGAVCCRDREMSGVLGVIKTY
jgi:hypothetical protein